MIVRISTQGQYRVDSDTLDKVSELDDSLMKALEDEDKPEFSRLLAAMVELVKTEGEPVPTGEIVESDMVLPPPDTTLEEARRLYPAEKPATRS